MNCIPRAANEPAPRANCLRGPSRAYNKTVPGRQTGKTFIRGSLPVCRPGTVELAPSSSGARVANYQRTTPVQAVSRITPPNTMRYQANAANECLLT